MLPVQDHLLSLETRGHIVLVYLSLKGPQARVQRSGQDYRHLPARSLLYVPVLSMVTREQRKTVKREG